MSLNWQLTWDLIRSHLRNTFLVHNYNMSQLGEFSVLSIVPWLLQRAFLPILLLDTALGSNSLPELLFHMLHQLLGPLYYSTIRATTQFPLFIPYCSFAASHQTHSKGFWFCFTAKALNFLGNALPRIHFFLNSVSLTIVVSFLCPQPFFVVTLKQWSTSKERFCWDRNEK